MTKHHVFIAAGLALVAASSTANAQQPAGTPVPVTVDNFTRAESDMYIRNNAKAAFGTFAHNRGPADINNQTVIRLNRDTLYSFGVFDLDADPVTITLPDAGGRFMSLQVVNEDHYVPAVTYDPGPHTFTRESVGTRYAVIAIRTLVDPNDPRDLQQVQELQDAIKVDQKDRGKLELPNWDEASQTKIRDALLVLARFTDGFRHAFGTKDAVDPVRHLIGTAAGWGGNPDKDAIYLSFAPPKDDGKTVYKLTVKDVPVEAFWSISVYNAEGYFQKNDLNAYSLNDITAQKSADGSVAVQFGGCDGKIPNCLPIVEGWNYTVRLYRPRAEILNGTWTFPGPQAVN